MNKKGFTLIEVIGVVTVLAIILIVSVPALTKTLKRNEQQKYNNYIDNLSIAAENYIVKQLKEGYSFDDFVYIYLGDLVDSGYVNELATNPDNDKKLSRDTRIKISKDIDETFKYEIQEYYNTTDDYNKTDLVVHLDSIKYSKRNKLKNLIDGSFFDYSGKGNWTENGIYLDKDKNLNNFDVENYDTENITISINLKSIDELGIGESDYTYPIILYNDNSISCQFGFRKDNSLFYNSGNDTVFSLGQNISRNTNYTLTFVQEGTTTRKMYVNGTLVQEKTNLNLTSIIYNKILINPKLYDLLINNILIYNKALTAQEIQEIQELNIERFGE